MPRNGRRGKGVLRGASRRRSATHSEAGPGTHRLLCRSAIAAGNPARFLARAARRRYSVRQVKVSSATGEPGDRAGRVAVSPSACRPAVERIQGGCYNRCCSGRSQRLTARVCRQTPSSQASLRRCAAPAARCGRKRGQVAQVVERSPEKAGVGGSTPSLATIIPKDLAAFDENSQPTIQPTIRRSDP